MSKFDSWVMDQQEKEQEELAERLKKKENLKTFKVTERYIKEDTWIVNAINKEEATDIAMSVDPDSSQVVRLEELKTLPPAVQQAVVAVYPNSFKDLTGQRRSNSSFALFSTAITQAPEAILIRTLKHVANGEFFRVVERVGLDDLTKERQLIRTTRKEFENEFESSFSLECNENLFQCFNNIES